MLDLAVHLGCVSTKASLSPEKLAYIIGPVDSEWLATILGLTLQVERSTIDMLLAKSRLIGFRESGDLLTIWFHLGTNIAEDTVVMSPEMKKQLSSFIEDNPELFSFLSM